MVGKWKEFKETWVQCDGIEGETGCRTATWQVIRVPKTARLGMRKFLCGFCAATLPTKIKEVKKRMEEMSEKSEEAGDQMETIRKEGVRIVEKVGEVVKEIETWAEKVSGRVVKRIREVREEMSGVRNEVKEEVRRNAGVTRV